ncbi:MAG: hypothetical protein RLZZ74_2269, partial [Cyanobacteriota bacterium]
MKNDILLPRSTAQIKFDGRDKIGASKAIAVTRTGWAGQSSTLLADSWEVTDTLNYGKSFKVPIGENVNTGVDEIFEYVGLLVSASKNGTTVNIDANADGISEITATLNEGEVKFINGGIKTGASITTSQPVQANLITGNKSEATDLHPETTGLSTYYASRWYSLYPDDQLSNSYYTPVGDTNNNPTSVFVFNPNNTNINVSYEYRDTSNNNIVTKNITVTPGSTQRVILTSTSGHHFFSNNNFATVSAVSTGLGNSKEFGANSSNNATFDWGHTLPPTDSLSPVVVLGWSPGSNDVSPVDGKPDENFSPVWVTPTKDTRVYVNYSGDLTKGALTDPNGRKYDQHFDISRLDSLKISDTSDKDMTGARIYTVDGTNISVAWGQDPDIANRGAPSLDIGNTVPPLPLSTASKQAELAIDLNNNSKVNPGDTLKYTIDVKNNGLTNLSNVEMTDTVSTGASYIPGSATVNGIPIADDATGTPFPFDDDGINHGRNIGNINIKNSADITYRMRINNPYDGSKNEVTNLAIIIPDGDESIPAGVIVKVDNPPPGNITGNVSQDTDGDRLGDTAIAGVTLSLLDAKGNPVLDAAGNSLTATTDVNGNYSFQGLTPGDYTVVETQPNGYLNVSENEGGADDDQPDNNILNSIKATVASGENDKGNDFVEVKPGSLSGHISQDTDGDRTGDAPLANVELTLLDSKGNVVTKTTTDADGNYSFKDLTPGDYTVVETQPTGFGNVSEQEGGADDDQPNDNILNSIKANVAPGENDKGNDFVEVKLGSLSGSVAQDTDRNGLGDTSVEGVTLSLLDASGNPVKDGAGSPVTTTTDADGNYIFKDLTPGDYTVVETQPTGFGNVSEQEGGADDDQPDNSVINSIKATVAPGENDKG